MSFAERFPARSWLTIGCYLMLAFTASCSVFMAANQPSKKDLSVLNRGTPRAAVIRELGVPASTYDDDTHNHCHENYAFEQGYTGWTRAGRAGFHLVADVFTLGLWEIVATPTELYFDGTEVSLEIVYDENDRVDSVCVYSGLSEITAPTVSSETLRERLHDEDEQE